jgi:hypothetical protein
MECLRDATYNHSNGSLASSVVIRHQTALHCTGYPSPRLFGMPMASARQCCIIPIHSSNDGSSYLCRRYNHFVIQWAGGESNCVWSKSHLTFLFGFTLSSCSDGYELCGVY